ncbi:probable anion transporter 6, chloroplastic isoform X2 [Tripterygium wilfordii]|uniref:probable anion transporter 6, chloroplastic isoform X2 n=1 Tax=Tripterygium wilfordii TaxID=458696 RepID=UPI0018F7F0E5|nr:probable anion transporter 6, chloroplastic isoform X2 [Tripterygium wilfordii]
MAKVFAVRADSFCLPTDNVFNHTSLAPRHRNLHLFSYRNRLRVRVLCNIREKEILKKNETVPGSLTGLDVDDLDELGSNSGRLGSEGGSGEVGFDLNWPPWKNVPQRYKLIGTTSLAFVICNMDKVNLSIAIIPMSHQFGWSPSVAGLVQASFFWGYALSQLPGGWLAKIFGGRKVLEIGVLIWSIATALLPSVAGFMPGLVLSRILVGIGEGVSPSAATDLIAKSIPLAERSRAVAFVFGGLSVGSVAGVAGFFWLLPLFKLLVGNLYSTYLVCWALAESQTINMNKPWKTSVEELVWSLKDVPWRAFFRSEAVWAMIYAHFCGSWGHYTCLSWLPTYFSEELNLNLTEAAWVSILPPLASILVTSIAAQFADYLISSGVETTKVRKLCQAVGFLSPAFCMTLSSVDLGLPPWEVVGILTGGLALSSFALSGLYCTHQDISPKYASILLGITNTVGAVPGIVGVALTGYLLDSTHSWSISLFAPSIFFYLTGTIVWLMFASSKPQTFSQTE